MDNPARKGILEPVLFDRFEGLAEDMVVVNHVEG